MKRYISLLLLILFYTNNGWAQLLTRKHERFGDTQPKAILVRLKSEQNRIKYFEKVKNLKETERVKEDALKVVQAIKNDFKDNFSFCPVYYFIDTNTALVRTRQLDGVLYDSTGAIASSGVPGKHDRYMIVSFGPPGGNFPESKDVTRIGYTGINVFNEDFSMLTYEKALRFIYINPHQNLRNKANQSPYAYESLKYDIYHYPAAAKLQDAFESYYLWND